MLGLHAVLSDMLKINDSESSDIGIYVTPLRHIEDREERMEENGELWESLSSENSPAVAVLNSWHLWSPTQDQHKIKPVKTSAIEEGRVHKLTPRAVELSVAGLGKETHFSSGM